MGFQTAVIPITHFQAQCSQERCIWIGPLREQHNQAEADAAEHIGAHYKEWNKYIDSLDWSTVRGTTADIINYDGITDEPYIEQRCLCGPSYNIPTGNHANYHSMGDV